MKRITFDFETRSRSNLKKEGAYKYSKDPSTQPTCLAAKFHGQDAMMFLEMDEVNRPWSKVPDGFRYHWQRAIKNGYEFSAHNAFFERCIYQNILVERYGWPMIPFKQYRCTAAKAAACALPRNLEGAGAALKLSDQKDKRGYVAMMATCRPTRKHTDFGKMVKSITERLDKGQKLTPKQLKWQADKLKFQEPKMFLEPEDDPSIWNTLYEYCRRDVLAEEAVDNALPDLIPQEQEIWHLNQELNWRGLRVDLPTVQKIVDIMSIESKKKLKELDTLTMGLITKPGARNSILEFLAQDGIILSDIRSKTVDDNLQGFALTEDARKLLEIRKALSMTSTRKYQSILDRAMPDQRARDILLYHGASTGRDTGTGVQPHNFPRGLLKINKERPYAHVENVVECGHEMLQILYGESLGVLFSAILRNMILPSPNHELYVGDFSQIEVAVLWWLADNVPGLKVLRDGKDPYKYMAAANTGREYFTISDDGDERQLGKAQVLGCGFGMGPPKFQKTAWDMYRLKLTEEQSKIAVANYRQANEAVPILWKAYEKAAIAAVDGYGIQTAGKCKFFMEKSFLWVQLPSGRRLAYRDPQLSMRETDFGPRQTLEFWAVNSKTKKWALERTWGGTLTENIVQAVARDLMMQGIVRLEKKGYHALLTVHDEALCEKPIDAGGDVEDFVAVLCAIPKWGLGLPIKAKGWKGPRYRK